MTDERILLDNLHGRVVALMALCTAIAASHKDVDGVLRRFKADLQYLNSSSNPEMKNDNYVLGVKAVYDHLEFVTKQTFLDLSLLTQEMPDVEH
jgi:hypothetical protein